MAQLACKTRGDTGPQGKPRVYFCCHPADFSLYFEEICADLLTRQNCAVFYPEGGTAVYDGALLADLAQVQLFVMPVTARLLTGDDPALTVAFPFAVAHHIPVLPLMQESGLDAVFNEKCGDLQYLDRHNTDPTVIPYEEKLTLYLDSVLVGDELAAQVRAAFDAYIFLSYRKKDRQYAQELMRLIHQNDFCRDIAIWYDEFLTPGEDFNEAIRQALEKSGLFVLAVTPNLVNEPNYIQQIEYPLAMEQGKIILPAEMVPTDRQALAEKYTNIPPCADARDPLTLTAALSATLMQLAVRENDSDPQHNFFIGLAYLGGIDVEVDHARALELITGAAEAGLKDAMKKLATMYREGVGVARDYEEAIRWQEKIVATAKAAYEKAPSKDTLDTLLLHVLICGNDCFELGYLEKAKTCYAQGEPILHSAYRMRTIDTLSAQWAQTAIVNGLGDIALAEGDLTEARQHYERSLALRKELTEITGAEDDRWDMASSYSRLGDICLAEGNSAGAERYYKAALIIRQKLATDIDTADDHRNLSISYEKLGDVYEVEGDLEKAKQYYLESLAIRKSQAEEADTQQAWSDLSVIYYKLGYICEAQGNPDEAKEYYLQDLTISERLAEETDTRQAHYDLSVSYEKLGDICREEGAAADAKYYYQRCLTVGEKLALDGEAPEYWERLAIACCKLASLVSRDEQRALLRRALSIYQKLRCKCPHEERYQKLCNTIISLLQ